MSYRAKIKTWRGRGLCPGFYNFAKKLLRVRYSFFLLVFSLIWTGTRANQPVRYENYRPVHDLTHEWLMFDQDEEVYVPYVYNSDKEFQTFGLSLDLSRFPHAYLLVRTPEKPANIFINNALERVCKEQHWLVYSVDSLRREYKSEEIYFSFFTVSSPQEVTVYMGFPSGNNAAGPSVREETSVREVVRLTPRSVSRFNSGVAIAFVLSLVVMSFVSSNYFRVYGKYYSLRDVLSTRVKEDLFIIGKPLDRPSLLFVILLSVVLGFLILMLQFGGLSLIDGNFFFQSGNTFAVHTVNFLKLCLLVFIVYVVKFFYLNIMGKLFNLGRVTDLHYFKVIQCSLFFYSLLLLVALVMYNTYIPIPESIGNYLVILLMVFYFCRGLLIYFTINRESNVKFLYLFSYLCIAEALPVILGMRFLF